MENLEPENRLADLLGLENQPLDPRQAGMFPNYMVDEAEAAEIVNECNKFKKPAVEHARPKKEVMRTCYAYSKSQFVGGDLLPMPTALGSERDANKDRPRVFIPVSRQTLKQLYSYLKLTLFPNDEDYFRIKGKTAQAAEMEDELTEAVKHKFAELLVSEKISKALYNVIWSGQFVCYPSIRDEIRWEWEFDPQSQQYMPYQIDSQPICDIEALNPLHFYPDPRSTEPECARWVYVDRKKLYELLDSNLYFNKEKLKEMATNGQAVTAERKKLEIDSINDLTSEFVDNQKNVDYDFYYFPYLKTTNREYRNMLVGVACESVLVRFHPNMIPGGLNPAVFTDWLGDVDSPYGTGPLEDIKDLQKLTNILHNYMIEVLSRIGNRFAVRKDVDVTNLFGIAGGVAITEDPGRDIVSLTGDYTEINELANIIGTVKAEAQITSGAQNPFQGASEIDFKKTATEMQILQENTITTSRENASHITIMGVQRVLERLMYILAVLFPEPIQVRVDKPVPQMDPMTGQPMMQIDPRTGQPGPVLTNFITADLSVLKSGQFTIELVSMNPSQSKQAQSESLTKLLEIVGNNPMLLTVGRPIIEKLGQLQGIKDIGNTIDEVLERLQQVGPQAPPAPPPAA